jgi:hypothetical protein
VTAWRFREARLQLFTSVEDCARLLHVSERTIRGWESGATRIPYASYKLLRVLKGGRYLAHPSWRDYVIRGDVLFTPEGHRFQAGELAWWSLLVRQAHAFAQLMAAQRADLSRPKAVSVGAGASAVPASSIPEMGRPDPVEHGVGRSPTLGLSLTPSKENKSRSTAFHAGPDMPPISDPCDTVSPAGVASAGLAPGADIPDWCTCRPLAPLPHLGGEA